MRHKNSKSSIPILRFLYNICLHLQNISTIIVSNTQKNMLFLPQREMEKGGKLSLFTQG